MNHQNKSMFFVNRLFTGTAVSLLLLAFSAVAQSAAHRDSSGMDRLTDRLDLTDAQRPQVQAILAESREMRRATIGKPYRDMNEDEREAFGDEMTAIREDTDAKLAKVLSAEQMARLRDLREERLQAFRDRRQEYRKRRDAGMDGMARRLQLTDTQRSQVAAILAESSAMRRYVFMKPYRDMSEEERETASAEMTAIRDETDAELAKVLSSEQMAELQEMREERLEMFRERRQQYLKARGG